MAQDASKVEGKGKYHLRERSHEEETPSPVFDLCKACGEQVIVGEGVCANCGGLV